MLVELVVVEQVTTLDPDYPEAVINLANVFVLTGRARRGRGRERGVPGLAPRRFWCFGGESNDPRRKWGIRHGRMILAGLFS